MSGFFGGSFWSGAGGTPVVSGDAYATIPAMLQRYDWRVIGDLVSDDNTQVALADLASNPVLEQMLQDASGDIDAAVMVGERYSAAELASLTGNSREHLERITCDIAMAYLLRRRVQQDPERAAAYINAAEEHLERMRKGINVFDLDPQKDAGLPDVAGPSLVDYRSMHLIRDRTRNYYPTRRIPENNRT